MPTSARGAGKTSETRRERSGCLGERGHPTRHHRKSHKPTVSSWLAPQWCGVAETRRLAGAAMTRAPS